MVSTYIVKQITFSLQTPFFRISTEFSVDKLQKSYIKKSVRVQNI